MMRMHAPLFSSAIVAGFLTGCGTMASSQIDVEPVPTNEQQVIYRRGVPLIQSVGEDTTVVVAPMQTPRRDAYRNNLWVSVSNNSAERRFLFSINDVSVEYNEGSVKVLSYAEAKNEAYAAMQDQKTIAALAYTAQSWNAQIASTSQVRSTSTLGTSYQVYDPAKTQQLNMQAGAQLQSNERQAESAYQSRVGALKDYVRRDTIIPGETFGGYFLFNIPNFQPGKSNDIKVKVNADNEVHVFRFREFNYGLNPSEIDSALSVHDQLNSPPDTSNGIYLKGRKLWGS